MLKKNSCSYYCLVLSVFLPPNKIKNIPHFLLKSHLSLFQLILLKIRLSHSGLKTIAMGSGIR